MFRILGVAAAMAATVLGQEKLQHGSFAAFLADIKAAMPRSRSNAFVAPSAAELAAFTVCMRSLLDGDIRTAAPCFDGVNYSLHSLVTSGRTYLIAAERRSGFKGLGSYIVDPSYARNVVFEAPHPLFDINTAEEGLTLLAKVRARALFISGTHRCANADSASGCSGRTSACGGAMPYRISDAAHFDRNFFTAAHRATLRLAPQPFVISLHGNRAEPVDAELSDGTSIPAAADSVVIRLRNALEAHGVKAGSCNWPADDPSRFRLCGGTNVQGRLSNGSVAACTEQAKQSSGYFIHIEQRRTLRDHPEPFVKALTDVFQ